jgi:DNA adenine methylase
MSEPIAAPFPWFGGKRKVAAEVWAAFGDVSNYVEPFFGSGAVLLGRPGVAGIETVNDLDGFVANFWRAVQHDPDGVAMHADNPVNENDLHARHSWLVAQIADLQPRLEGDPNFFDSKIAGWWVWGVSTWIGSGFCSGNGPWVVDGGKLVNRRSVPHLGGAGRGVNRKLPHLGGAGNGVNGRLHMGDTLLALSARLRGVRVASGDWSRVCGPSVTHKLGLTGVFLDPPYADTAGRCEDAHDVREWAIAEGDNPLMRIALCGYDTEHVMPGTWRAHTWSAGPGYGNQADVQSGNGRREVIWFSPHCTDRQRRLF